MSNDDVRAANICRPVHSNSRCLSCVLAVTPLQPPATPRTLHTKLPRHAWISCDCDYVHFGLHVVVSASIISLVVLSSKALCKCRLIFFSPKTGGECLQGSLAIAATSNSAQKTFAEHKTLEITSTIRRVLAFARLDQFAIGEQITNKWTTNSGFATKRSATPSNTHVAVCQFKLLLCCCHDCSPTTMPCGAGGCMRCHGINVVHLMHYCKHYFLTGSVQIYKPQHSYCAPPCRRSSMSMILFSWLSSSPYRVRHRAMCSAVARSLA